MAASDQIRQMVNFILQEAHEKANEIRVKVSVQYILFFRVVFMYHCLVVFVSTKSKTCWWGYGVNV